MTFLWCLEGNTEVAAIRVTSSFFIWQNTFLQEKSLEFYLPEKIQVLSQ